MTAFIYTTVGRIVADDNLNSHTYNEGRQIIAEAKQSLQTDVQRATA